MRWQAAVQLLSEPGKLEKPGFFSCTAEQSAGMRWQAAVQLLSEPGKLEKPGFFIPLEAILLLLFLFRSDSPR